MFVNREFDEKDVNDEKTTIESEFQTKRNSNWYNRHQILKSAYAVDHPERKFGLGNGDSLRLGFC